MDQTLRKHGQHLALRLGALAEAGSQHAAQLLTDMQDEPDEGQLQRARTALDRLTAPVVLQPGIFSYGTGIGSDVALASLLPGAERARAALALVAAAQEPDLAVNRGQRVLGAAQLASPVPDRLPADHVRSLFETALAAAAAAPQPSPADLATAGFGHPLAGGQVTMSDIDLRPQWTLLAARAAVTAAEFGQVRQQIIALLALDTGDSAWYLAQALRVLPAATLAGAAPLLAIHPHWAVRSVAALAWAADTDPDSMAALGAVFARDSDPRVRRALADGLAAQPPSTRSQEAHDLLAADARYSVRRLN